MIRYLLTFGVLASSVVTAAAESCCQSSSPSASPAAACELPICCDRCIDYKVLRPRLEPCGPRLETTLLVKDAWACCFVPIKMCLPNCCTDDPVVCAKGKHVVEYTWSSGYKVRVILTRHGKVFVHYNA